ncbi:MAG: ACT domain-containing protein [Nitrosopumilaceae archaeon]|uniref:ACT domain-containing protein n=3 Tax=Candidatus Nitrosomaritimum aestuariumsis TaxID=3342354 RepID=A0AC60VW25_9ARCH|nr:ACT domain-containing protein [Nitrosopumilaceae archaeon]MBA4454979.1 ACT domain-containing protein [Nitrosopumilaceae archaeon]MBA4460317.1 ACT domain-containing protein [Nitrosopumilaceae archaeon]MBA4461155.1 ACT domain-containing protein [Nitrosopumilaceae archaeon]MBA4463834.1 ACT domain-containing protein [Nitrosopumilaceae archaeon]
MRITNMSVPEVVRETITRNRSVFDCLKMDLINYTALALKIQPEVERALGNSINLNTIVVAIKRFADSLEVKEEVEEQLLLKNARLALTDGIVDIKFSMKDSQNIDPLTILDKFSKITTNYDFFRSSDTFRFLAEDLDDIREIFDTIPNRENIFSTGLAKIRISIPPNQNKSDVVSYVAEVLHDNGIELANAFFSQDNIILILNERDSSKAYDVLHSAILRTA